MNSHLLHASLLAHFLYSMLECAPESVTNVSSAASEIVAVGLEVLANVPACGLFAFLECPRSR